MIGLMNEYSLQVFFRQVRYSQLMKQQEKMIQDMEKSVTRREFVITR